MTGTAKFYQNVSLGENELQNARFQSLGSAPATGTGRFYLDTSGGLPYILKYYNGSGWISVIAAGTGDVTSGSASTDGEVVLYNSTTGKVIKRSNGITGIAKITAGVLSAGTAGTDYSLGTSANATGLVKSTTTTGALTTATSRTDYGEPTTALATGILKNTTTTGAHTIAVSGTDYAPGTQANATGIVKSTTTTGALTTAAIGTDYSGPTSALATGILKSTTTTGALTIASNATDYYGPAGTDVAITDGGTGASTLPSGLLKGAGTGAITAATIAADYAPSVGANATGMVYGTTTTGALTTATEGTHYYKPAGTDVAIADGGTGASTLGTYALKGNGTGAITQATLTDVLAPTVDFSMASHKLTLVTDPTSAQDAATKNYVDAIAANVHDYKDSVACATTAVLPTTPTYSNGTAGLGATLTAGSNAAFAAVDGVTVTSGDVNPRVLVANQVSTFQNGIYTVTTTGSGAAPWVLTRATDADTTTEVSAGTQVPVEGGTVNGGQVWVQSTTGAITIGTTAQVWGFYFKATSVQAGAGLTATSNIFAVGAGTGITVNTDDVQVNVTGAASGGATFAGGVDRKAYGTLTTANGVLTSFTITHGLTAQSSGAVNFDVMIAATGEVVYPSIIHASTTTVTIDFGAYAPALNEFLWKAAA